MEKAYSRRFLGALGFLGFLGFLGLMGISDQLPYLSLLSLLSLISLLVLVPFDRSKIKSPVGPLKKRYFCFLGFLAFLGFLWSKNPNLALLALLAGLTVNARFGPLDGSAWGIANRRIQYIVTGVVIAIAALVLIIHKEWQVG